MPFAPINEILQELRNGRMIVLVDDEDRENEGDLIIPAERCTADAMNFMMKFGRGVPFISTTAKRLEQLNVLRQREMTDETARLVRLANEVKAETNKSAMDSLSVVELRKVELIEKLAKSVREKMKATVGN